MQITEMLTNKQNYSCFVNVGSRSEQIYHNPDPILNSKNTIGIFFGN